MAYWVYLKAPDDGPLMDVNPHAEGNLVKNGKSTKAQMVLDAEVSGAIGMSLDKGLLGLKGDRGDDCYDRVRRAVAKLYENLMEEYPDGVFDSDNLECRAYYAMLALKDWCKEHPTAVFDISF